MARLLGVRPLETELGTSSSSARLQALAENDPGCFQNPAFDGRIPAGEEWSPSTASLHSRCGFTPTNNNNNLHTDHNKRLQLLSSDSGLSICMPPDLPSDSSSVGRTSPDSGVHDLMPNNSSSGNGSAKNGDCEEWRAVTLPVKKDSDVERKETLLAVCVQIFIPFLIAGAGTCGAGIVLDYVEDWEVFKKVSELFILVPTLLGLKGNLEMTLASRVSTQANLGKLDTWREKWQMAWGNMAIIQCQATVMGLLAAGFATVSRTISRGFSLHNAMLLGASSLATASVASLVLGSITIGVVVVSHRCRINPDNVATPIAASLGDVITLAILAAVASFLYLRLENLCAPSIMIAIFLLLVPIWVYLSYINPFVRQVLKTGWIPIIIALIITSIGGFTLEASISKFKGFAIFQPVINGVAGNLVAVQASRISTYFHRHGEKPGSRPPDGSPVCISPLAAYFGKGAHARTARILLSMVVPGHVLFGYAISFAKGGETTLTASPSTFLPIYLAAAFLQVALLLYTAQCLIHVLWRFKIDPDNSAIPLLTALGDLSGIFCLTAAFHLYDII